MIHRNRSPHKACCGRKIEKNRVADCELRKLNAVLRGTAIYHTQKRQTGQQLPHNATGFAPVSVLIPLRGLSMIDAEGGPFWWPEADRALFDALKEDLRDGIPVIELDCNVNDPGFARRCAAALLAGMGKGK